MRGLGTAEDREPSGLPLSKDAGRRLGRRMEAARVLLGGPPAAGQNSFVGLGGLLERLVGGCGPDESGQLACDRDDDRAILLAAAAQPEPALVKALLGAHRALDGERVLVATATLDPRSWHLAGGGDSRPPRRASRRACALPALVIEPGSASRRRSAPRAPADEAHERLGVSRSARSRRSPRNPTALSVSMPRRQRSRATSSAYGTCGGLLDEPSLECVDAPVDEINARQVIIERDLRSGLSEDLLAEPGTALDRPRLCRHSTGPGGAGTCPAGPAHASGHGARPRVHARGRAVPPAASEST